MKETATQAATRSAWASWLAEHPISVAEIIEDAVKDAMTQWLDDHEDEIIERLAERASRRQAAPTEAVASEQPKAGAQLTASEGFLYWLAPRGLMTPVKLAWLKQHKAALLEVLSGDEP